VIHSEWIKFRTVRSNVIGVAAAGVTVVALGAMFSSFAGTEQATGPAAGITDPLRLSLSGFNIAQLVIGVIGVLVGSSEYTSGLIRTTFSTVSDHLLVLRAKALVYGGVAFVVGTLGALLAVMAGTATYAGTEATPSLTDGATLQAIVGMGVYVTGIGVIGLALGFLLRGTASAVGVLVGGLLIAPGLVGLLPDSVSDTTAKLLPSMAGAAFSDEAITMGRSSDLLSAGWGLAVFAVWVLGLLAAAAVVVRRRDA
jgi:ABC-2 type transport system permease protein